MSWSSRWWVLVPSKEKKGGTALKITTNMQSLTSTHQGHVSLRDLSADVPRVSDYKSSLECEPERFISLQHFMQVLMWKKNGEKIDRYGLFKMCVCVGGGGVIHCLMGPIWTETINNTRGSWDGKLMKLLWGNLKLFSKYILFVGIFAYLNYFW